jgi:hypothetical protein
MDTLDKPTKIIYPNADGTISIVISTGVLPIEEIGRKDVPAGLPFKFIADKDIPTDMEFRQAWSANFSKPDGYGIGPEAWFAEQKAKLQKVPSDKNLDSTFLLEPKSKGKL